MQDSPIPLSPAFLALERSQMKKRKIAVDGFDEFFDKEFSHDVGCLYYKRMAKRCYEQGQKDHLEQGDMPEPQDKTNNESPNK
tara:strand:- start:502 stop:750 length:249 start_codon:yes stop_codon:yes gene_type:complete